jgi:hypothetical protein
MPSAPNTPAVASAIVAYGQALTFSGGGAVYTKVQNGEIKDITDLVASGTQACLEVYANLDDSQRYAFGGRIRDEQTWFLLSIVSLDNAAAAETLIYKVRDALVQPLQEHATLGSAGSVFHSELKAGSGKFLKIMRNGEWLRAHLIELMTRQEWQVPAPGVIA